MMLRSLILVAGLLAAAPSLAADGAARAWEAGRDYFLVEPPQPTRHGDKIEVLEVFSYACPHCAHFQPYAEKLKATLPKNAEFALMPADFQPRWVMFARGFYAAKALGLVDKTHQAMFDAIYRDHLPLDSMDAVAGFYAAHGADKATFLSTADSFVVDGNLQQVRAREIAYRIDSTPTIIVDGRFRVVADADKSIGYDEMLEIVQHLVARQARKKH